LTKEVSKKPNTNVTIIGHSHEGRSIYLVKIEPEKDKKKPVIFIEAGAHAREWVAPAVALGLIHNLIQITMETGNFIFNKSTSLRFAIGSSLTHQC
jgi:murein tripeptide amidase MpaA